MPSYSVRCAVGQPGAAPGPTTGATLAFSDTDLVIACDPAPPIEADLADLVGLEAPEAELRLTLASGLVLQLSGMGKTAAELVARLVAARRDRLAYAFRFGRSRGDRWDDADVVAAGETAPRRAGVRVFGSIVGIVPDRGDPLMVPLGDALAFDEGAYEITVDTIGGRWRFGRLARRSTPFLRELERARIELLTRCQAQLKDVMPHLPAESLRALSAEWREGVALPAESLDAHAPGSAARLLALLPADDRREFAARLARCFAASPRLGFYHDDERDPERPFEPFALFQKTGGGAVAVAWEVLGEMGTATYVFRGPEPDLAERLNAALRSIRFAREPIYLSRDELLTTGTLRHLVPLLGRSPDLEFLRARFAGRVPHVDAERYATRVAALCGEPA